MMMLLKPLGLLCMAVIFLTACTGALKPKDMKVGLTLTNRAVNYELQGNYRMAAYTYTRAIAKFRDMGQFCDMARVALLMYTVDPSEQNEDKLNDAAAFSALGECSGESNTVDFLKGKKYDYSRLEKPYKSLAELRSKNDIGSVKSMASSSYTSDHVRSALYRIIAKYLLDKEPEDSIKYAEDAKIIDSKHAWTKNILANDEIILQASENLGMDTDIIKQRINVLKQALAEKTR